jgi:hypothetical protein
MGLAFGGFAMLGLFIDYKLFWKAHGTVLQQKIGHC